MTGPPIVSFIIQAFSVTPFLIREKRFQKNEEKRLVFFAIICILEKVKLNMKFTYSKLFYLKLCQLKGE
ncbi:hypothetical protein GFU50_14195 [Enterococcus casseliflavus]|uniref:Uncharacterized protein n=1 Tax=Enterococcus casseliflavus TaxID=37734 RepID=A0ABD6Z6N5_ENTCA|nr:hypothetical protein GFU50_14195 [Enterococcus casseliflavus]